MRATHYQLSLIFLGLVTCALFGYFLKKELFPEYKIYQNDYIALEKFRSSYSGEPPPAFKEEVKQIVIEREDHGPPVIDRCISCHVALQYATLSPTKLAKDVNGNPIQIPNEDYIWSKLDQKIHALLDPQVLANLDEEGRSGEVEERKEQAASLAVLKVAHVGDQTYDVTKVLRMHPLIGKETRPFEYHPLEEYGCVSCHNGNGRALTTDKAHGPVYDGHYETEFMGPKPTFLEKDRANDPAFSKIFNDKPAHALLFQTTPIYVGALIEAKCIQCHLPSSNGQEVISSVKSDIDFLTSHYRKGEELYLSQGCYACHRIAPFSRGGVGPELTRIGENYPWYIKEKMVWPQGTLKTSTMPNYHLDHEELEDLMTFLLGQTGQKKVFSPIEYKTTIQKWEAGKKMPWEQPLSPTQIHDTRYAMTLFATEGCAACHRLKGFESNIGFAIEKEGKPDFNRLYKEKTWFQQLFPEDSSGSALVKKILEHGAEIDQRLGKVRDRGLLEEIDAKLPGDIESFYPNFKYALRAQNAYYQKQLDLETSPEKKAALAKELEEWRERVHRVLMIYVQEYGLGRLVCPRPNWSGIYRSNEWLMEHFRNPSSHVPKSIMPVFPFDDTKFYALTLMLDQLALQNRQELQQIWKTQGFDPAQAFAIHCAQCHGESREGDGPVSEWIYPIPKNLRNADFLRNLTKERVIESITHGVKGTPMPPWGEVAPDKPDALPVLTKEEIRAIADWLFEDISEENKMQNHVPKWNYTPEDVLRELKEEKSHLKADENAYSSFKNEMMQYAYASLEPQLPQTHPDLESLFDVVPSPLSGPDQDAYYIKKQYYTEENIEKGREFFELNCAVCHGKEADGMGARASFMYDAKPRMFTNLDWINTRDDLRLLRSIKYGVPGTAMTPWGDLTTSLQRIQLVLFIRNLTQQQKKREKLLSLIYKTFETAQHKIEEARVSGYRELEKIKAEYDQIKQERHQLIEGGKDSSNTIEQVANLYQKELNLLPQLKQQELVDEQYVQLLNAVKQEQQLYQVLGLELLNYQIDDASFDSYLKLVALNQNRYEIVNGMLHWQDSANHDQEIDEIGAQLILNLQNKISALEKEQEIANGKLPSAERTALLTHVRAEISSLTKLKNKVTLTLSEAKKMREQQKNGPVNKQI